MGSRAAVLRSPINPSLVPSMMMDRKPSVPFPAHPRRSGRCRRAGARACRTARLRRPAPQRHRRSSRNPSRRRTATAPGPSWPNSPSTKCPRARVLFGSNGNFVVLFGRLCLPGPPPRRLGQSARNSRGTSGATPLHHLDGLRVVDDDGSSFAERPDLPAMKCVATSASVVRMRACHSPYYRCPCVKRGFPAGVRGAEIAKSSRRSGIVLDE